MENKRKTKTGYTWYTRATWKVGIVWIVLDGAIELRGWRKRAGADTIEGQAAGWGILAVAGRETSSGGIWARKWRGRRGARGHGDEDVWRRISDNEGMNEDEGGGTIQTGRIQI